MSIEGDIYSYGIVLIEMITAKIPTDTIFEGDLDLHSYAKSAALSNELINMIDPKILNDGTSVEDGNEGEISAENERRIKCTRSVIEIGVKCSVESPQGRMKIKDAIGELRVTRVKGQGSREILEQELHIIRALQL